jgi:hypothetical protein
MDDSVGGGVLHGDEALHNNNGDAPFLHREGRWPWHDGGEEVVIVDIVVLLIIIDVILVDAVWVKVITISGGDIAPMPHDGGEAWREGALEW